MSAYLIGELSWPMPDPGLIAVWRAMSIDASKWDDWGELDVGTHAGTVGALVDDLDGSLEVGDEGVQLRGRFDDAEAWQRLVIAWRAAADLGASGQLVCCASPLAYKATVSDYSSRWAKLSARDVAALGIDDAPRHEPAKRTAKAKTPKATPAKRPKKTTAAKTPKRTAAKRPKKKTAKGPKKKTAKKSRR